MTQPIDPKEVPRLLRFYTHRLARSNPNKPSIHRVRLQKTIQVLEHYQSLCTVIDGPRVGQD
ncbi:hypothetical protein ES708_14389 [subsurface metagenome]